MLDEPTARNRPYATRTAGGRSLQQIGPYRIVRAIGEGGMGSVFLAQQDAPVQRNVAIKIIRSPFARVDDRVRFSAEQQAMARLHHPNVAQIFEAGTTEEGYPFFAMEWLDGEAITEYCDRRMLSIERRLELFISACDGVQHAHQKSIVHRDLKPSNMLVVEIDGRPVPKIIDFGIAKALDRPLADLSTLTGDGFVGTPAYLSPEAVKGAAQGDIDTRADVYALGLVLYKLLAGTQPYENDDTLLERMLSIANVELAPPHHYYLAQDHDEREAVAQRCSTTPSSLDRLLLGDLEAIVLKSVAKDREQRYGSVTELQADVRRFLAHETIEARTPSALQRLRKFTVRHRAAVAATTLIVIALVAGIIARTIEARRARAARQQAELVTRFLKDLFDAGNPWNGEITMHDLLREGAKRIDTQLRDAPLARAEVLNSIGSALMHQGDDELAAKLLREALAIRRAELGPDDPLVANTLVELGVLRQRYDVDEAERDLREAARIREKRLG
ncbi:MAG TPA: serine/threonine-protein kinase, partial [Thermoanaerobaculia bacterium]|nr:serine/threonine-protein kinase [Thermoanaerobaculia bacterium]